MEKFKVIVWLQSCTEVIVSAKNKREAKKKAYKKIAKKSASKFLMKDLTEIQY
jgi:hypothetical protein